MGCRYCRLCAHGGARAVLEPSRAAAAQYEMRNMDSDFPWEPAISGDGPDVPLGVVCAELQALGEGWCFHVSLPSLGGGALAIIY